MFLLIDTSQKDTIRLALFDEKELFEKRVDAQNRELLASIDAFFDAQEFSKENLQGIAALVGEGSFTSTRIAVTVANAFGYVLGVPLLAVTKDEASNIQDVIPKIESQLVGQYISASYSGEPNIGKKKH